ncbi:UDP-glucose 4-epimerase, partial [Salmonella enterica]|nr:UDP-glucose 4-epimerase [Salmonella enterica]
GDLDKSWADTEKARNLLGWEAKYGIEDMLQDVWNWQSHNPNGYRV